MYLDFYVCELCIRQRREPLALVLSMPICEELLATDWNHHTFMVTSKEGNKKNQGNEWATFCFGNNYCHVLEHLV
jgi:hypothetical protein